MNWKLMFSAAELCCVQFTCVGMLRMLSVPKGEYVLQTAAGSALGRQIIQVRCLSSSSTSSPCLQILMKTRRSLQTRKCTNSYFEQAHEILLQVSKSYGLKTINVVRRSEQKQELLDMG